MLGRDRNFPLTRAGAGERAGMAQPDLGSTDAGGDFDERELGVPGILAVPDQPGDGEPSVRLLVLPLEGGLAGVPGCHSEHAARHENRLLCLIIVRSYGHHEHRKVR